MTGTGSPIGSVAAGMGSPFGQWRLVRGDPGIGFAASARSPAPALRVVVVPRQGPPVLAAVGRGTTTSLLRLWHDK